MPSIRAVLQGLLWAGMVVVGCAQDPPLTIGFQANLGVNETIRFANTLEYLENYTRRTFQPMEFPNNSAFIQASVNQEFDFVYTGPVMFACLQLSGPGTKAMDEIVQLNKLDNVTAVEKLAGAIVVRETMNVTQPADLRGSVVITGNPLNLGSFQSQWYAVETPAFSLFRDTRAVFVSPSPLTILGDIQSRVGDVGFVEGGVLEAAQATANSTLGLKVVLTQNASEPYPYLHSTPLYASSLISGQFRTDFRVRANVSEALLAIPDASQLALEDNYYSFTTSGDYGTIRTVLTKQQFIDPDTNLCKVDKDLPSLVTCPHGFTQEVETARACEAMGIVCPAGYQCICSPCKPIRIPTKLSGLTVPAFSLMLIGIVAAGSLGFFVAVRLIVLQKPSIPVGVLNLGQQIGVCSHGPVVTGRYMGQPVAVKQVFPGRLQAHSMLGSNLLCDHLMTGVAALAECFWIRTQNKVHLAMVRARMEMRHPNIMPLVGVARAPGGGVMAVMPLMQAGTIADLMANQQYELDASMMLAIARDVAQAILFFHSSQPQVVGKNMKPHHLFLDNSWRTIIGLSFRPLTRRSIWTAPECMRGGAWSAQADSFAFGMLLYSLLHRKLPFEGRRSGELLDAMQDTEADTLGETRPPMDGDDPIHHLIRSCWAQDPRERPSFPAIIQSLDSMGGQGVGGGGPRPSFSMARTSSTLLQGMFPEHVRDLLEQGKPVPPQMHPAVTIFFSDIKGFTELSSLMAPSSVHIMLDTLYTFMDECAVRHGVHKMETIGDAFVAVTNLMQKQPDHAVRMAQFALEAIEGAGRIAVDPQRTDSPMLTLRCGLHTGPVASGVAGKSNVRFCLFGHSVNIASRMESTGEPGRIQMTRETACAITAEGSLQDRVKRRPGQVDVKGQGKMNTYWLMNDADLFKHGQHSDVQKSDSRRHSFDEPKSRRNSLLQLDLPSIVVE